MHSTKVHINVKLKTTFNWLSHYSSDTLKHILKKKWKEGGRISSVSLA